MFNQDQDVNVSSLVIGHMLLQHSQERHISPKLCFSVRVKKMDVVAGAHSLKKFYKEHTCHVF